MELYAGLIEFNWTLVMMWVTVLVLYLILKRHFFEKVHNFMQDRQNTVIEAFDNAERVNLQADQKLIEYNKHIQNIESEGREIIKNAKIKADAQAKDITDDASRRANEMILQAQREVEREKLKAINEMKNQIGTLAIYAAEKIIEKQLEGSGQEEIIQRIIEQAGKIGMAELTVDLTYGKALYEAASDVNKTDVILEEAQELVGIFKNEPEFFELISTPVISAAEKKVTLTKIFSGKICDELLNLLFILIDKGRTKQFASIVRRYKQLIDQSHGFSLGTIFSVKPLSKEQLQDFEGKTGKLIQKNVKLENKTDSTLIGGVRIFIEGKVIDASIRKRLNDLSESLR